MTVPRSLLIQSAHILLTLCFFTLLLTCEKDPDFTPTPEPEFEYVTLDSVLVSGTIELPLTSINPDSVQIISGFHEGEFNLSYASSSGLFGTFSIYLNQDAVQLVMLLYQEEPIAYALMVPDEPESLKLDSETTAKSLLYFHPMIMSDDLDFYHHFNNYISQSAHFASYVEEVNTKMAANDLNFSALSTSFVGTLNDYFDNIIDFIEDVIDINSVALDIVQYGSGENIRYEVLNRRKRWLAVYAEAEESGVSIPKTIEYVLPDQIDLFEQFLLPFGEFLRVPSAEIEILSPLAEERSELIKVNGLERAERLTFSCYGLADPSTLPDPWSQDFINGIDPLVFTNYFDLYLPLMGVISGGANLAGRRELRGRPNGNAARILRTKLKEEFLSNEFREDAANAIIEQDELVFLEAVLDAAYRVLNAPENQKLVLDVFGEIFGRKPSLAAVKKIPIYRYLTVFDELFKLGNTVYAYSTSEWKTEFSFDIEPTIVEEGEFTIYPITLGEFGALSSLAVAPDNSAIWVSDGYDLYEYDPGNDGFVKQLFWDEAHLAMGGGITQGVFGLDIQPGTNDLYILVGTTGTAGSHARIYKKNAGDYEIFYETFTNSHLISAMGFDPNGNLWIQELDDNYNVIRLFKANGEEDAFDLNAIPISVQLASRNINGASEFTAMTFSQNGLPLFTRENAGSNFLYELSTNGVLSNLYSVEDPNGDFYLQGGFQDKAGNVYFTGLLDFSEVVLQQYQPIADTSLVFTDFGGIPLGFANAPSYFFADNAAKIWFGASLVENAVFYFDGEDILALTPDNSNLPGTEDPYFGNWVNAIDGADNGRAWFVYGNRMVMRANF